MSDVLRALNRVCKWRTILAGWQLGTRRDDDPECQAVRDYIDRMIVLRVEATALTKLLLDKGVFDQAELADALCLEADELSKMYEARFPGMRATDTGIHFYDLNAVKQTMKGWRP